MERKRKLDLGSAAKVNPRTPSRGIRFADVVRQIFRACTRSDHHSFQEFQHLFSTFCDLYIYLSSSSEKRAGGCGYTDRVRDRGESGINRTGRKPVILICCLDRVFRDLRRMVRLRSTLVNASRYQSPRPLAARISKART